MYIYRPTIKCLYRRLIFRKTVMGLAINSKANKNSENLTLIGRSYIINTKLLYFIIILFQESSKTCSLLSKQTRENIYCTLIEI